MKAASARQQCSNSWPTKLENERLSIQYSSLLPVYIIPTVSHQEAWMKSFHLLSLENLFSSLKLDTVAQRTHRCSTFTEQDKHLIRKSKVKVCVSGVTKHWNAGLLSVGELAIVHRHTMHH